MAGGRTSFFYYDPDKWSVEDILNFVQALGLVAKKSKRMVYFDNDEILDNWPIKGYLIENHDISFEPPEEHPQFGPLGRVDCSPASAADFSPEINKKLYNKLKRKFGMTRADEDKKDRWFGDGAE